jgi:cobalt-zinc-cadmium resistance protein CzcA
MVRKLIEWAVNNPLIVLLMTAALVVWGGVSFFSVNVEAYPDPAPAIVEVIAQYPGASAEEVEREVTIPLEVALAGMPGLKYTRTKSLFGLSHLRNQFDYGIDFYAARQEVLNRLSMIQGAPPGQGGLPPNVSPGISAETPTGEIYRFTLESPKDAFGKDIYSLKDLKALNDFTVVRELSRVERIGGVASSGGEVKRYEIHPDPNAMKARGITLTQLQQAIQNANQNVGGDIVRQGPTSQNVRGMGLFGGGLDPMKRPDVLSLESKELDRYLAASNWSEAQKKRMHAAYMGGALKPPLDAEEKGRLKRMQNVVRMTSAARAAAILREEDRRRLQQIRSVVITSVNSVPILVEDVVDGGPLAYADAIGLKGVVVGNQTRLGRVSLSMPITDAAGATLHDSAGKPVWIDHDDKVQGIVLLRKNADSLPALHDVEEKVAELNRPGSLLPGVRIVPYYDRTALIHVTTETVRENLVLGMILVTVILLMFLSNVRSALIVAVNIPLALLFAFGVLHARGKSANLLSIGAVDFGIIVDSSVIMVENIYRHITSHEYADLPLKDRIIRASHEVQHALFFSTAIMVCAFIPLFTMKGPEGQIFGPMADTYAFALGGALLLSLTVAPVLCLIFFRNLQPTPDNFLVRYLKRSYLRQLERCLNHRGITLGIFGALTLITIAVLPILDREFMPELEEGNLWIRATFPLNVSLEEAATKVEIARAIMREYPEVEAIVPQIGRPDDGTDPCGFYNVEFFVPLKPDSEWPSVKKESWPWSWWSSTRPRTKVELSSEMNAELDKYLVGVDWNFSQNIRDNVMEALSGVKGDNSVKIIGPDLQELDQLGNELKGRFDEMTRNHEGVVNAGVFHILGQPNLEFLSDYQKFKKWGVSASDVNNVIATAVGGKAFSTMKEGEKAFDIALRWPGDRRGAEQAILDIPVDISNNTVTQGTVPSVPQTPQSGGGTGVSSIGTMMPMPNLFGNVFNAAINNLSATPRRRLGDLISPTDGQGHPDPGGSFVRPGASTIYREQGKRLIAVKFSVSKEHGLASVVSKAQERSADLFTAPYRAEWSGEFQEMEEAEHRLMLIVPLSLSLIFVLLYLAFHSLLDVLSILSNVIALSLGGIWALLLTGTHFSISAAVGFISIFGVAIMDGLLLISYFNQMRVHGLPLREAIMQGAEKRVRPIMMTALTAIFGLLPAALSTRIGSQTQRPLAIVVVGGMITTVFLTRYLMPVLYSFYGHREPPAGSGGMAH